ncbi:MAG: hypothetical protein WCF26_20410 [Candidatus Sulfotelmatobacter sp.]
MVKSKPSASQWKFWTGQALLPLLCLLLCAAALPAHAATDFTLTTLALNPNAVVPGEVSSTNISVATSASGGTFSSPVSLTCTVTPSVPITSQYFPVCTVSPPSLTAPGGATATITTVAPTPTIPGTPTIAYNITVTGTDASGSLTSQPLTLTVLSVVPQYTISVQTALQPTSVPAGSGSQGIISVNPSNGYRTINADGSQGYITLYCSTITPLVTIAPVCTFNYDGKPGVEISGTGSATANLIIQTSGGTVQTTPTPSAANTPPRDLPRALWLSLPLLGLVSLGAALGGRKSRKAWGILTLFVVSASLLLLGSCVKANSNLPTANPNGVTPANTYTFTLVGVDTNGVGSSNTGVTGSPTVTLTVTAPNP